MMEEQVDNSGNLIAVKPHACHICGSEAKPIAGYETFHRVTSDCKPWPPGGKLAVCETCACAQAVIDKTWENDAKTIYANYAIYHQSQQGAEQSVFDSFSGQPLTRSGRLVCRLQQQRLIPSQGRLLDMGCGNGAFLRAFGQRAPEWKMCGLEVSDHYRHTVEQIPGVERFFTGEPEAVPGTYELITLIHALEHIHSPQDFLTRLGPKLAAGGMLLIQVPDCEQTPFMLLVADHASHFFVKPLEHLVKNAGYDVCLATTDWVAKEITILARAKVDNRRKEVSLSSATTRSVVVEHLKWLKQIANWLRALADRQALGLFGTSIAATWLFQELDGRVSFFVDEDPARAGQEFLGRPIYDPERAPRDTTIFIALPPLLAEDVKTRLLSKSLSWQLVTPDSLSKTA